MRMEDIWGRYITHLSFLLVYYKLTFEFLSFSMEEQLFFSAWEDPRIFSLEDLNNGKDNFWASSVVLWDMRTRLHESLRSLPSQFCAIQGFSRSTHSMYISKWNLTQICFYVSSTLNIHSWILSFKSFQFMCFQLKCYKTFIASCCKAPRTFTF